MAHAVGSVLLHTQNETSHPLEGLWNWPLGGTRRHAVSVFRPPPRLRPPQHHVFRHPQVGGLGWRIGFEPLVFWRTCGFVHAQPKYSGPQASVDGWFPLVPLQPNKSGISPRTTRPNLASGFWSLALIFCEGWERAQEGLEQVSNRELDPPKMICICVPFGFPFRPTDWPAEKGTHMDGRVWFFCGYRCGGWFQGKPSQKNNQHVWRFLYFGTTPLLSLSLLSW